MRLIICGSRSLSITDDMITQSVNPSLVELVISGDARGPDRDGARWARNNNIELRTMPADWNTHGRGAGFIRNEEMLKHATHVLAFWDRTSRGTKHMIDISLKGGRWTRIIHA